MSGVTGVDVEFEYSAKAKGMFSAFGRTPSGVTIAVPISYGLVPEEINGIIDRVFKEMVNYKFTISTVETENSSHSITFKLKPENFSGILIGKPEIIKQKLVDELSAAASKKASAGMQEDEREELEGPGISSFIGSSAKSLPAPTLPTKAGPRMVLTLSIKPLSEFKEFDREKLLALPAPVLAELNDHINKTIESLNNCTSAAGLRNIIDALSTNLYTVLDKNRLDTSIISFISSNLPGNSYGKEFMKESRKLDEAKVNIAVGSWKDLLTDLSKIIKPNQSQALKY